MYQISKLYTNSYNVAYHLHLNKAEKERNENFSNAYERLPK